MMSTLDILPTFAKLVGARIPGYKPLDGVDQSDLITGKTHSSSRKVFYYHVKGELQAVREGNFKLLIPNTKLNYPYANNPPRTEPELYDLGNLQMKKKLLKSN